MPPAFVPVATCAAAPAVPDRGSSENEVATYIEALVAAHRDCRDKLRETAP